MNKYIEFVERKIKNEKNLLKKLKNIKTISNKYELKINESLTKNAEENIEYLQQIKTILEAWEEIKKYIIIKEGHDVFYDCTYEYIELKNGCIDESNSEEEGVSISSIKKALEVENV